MEGRRKSLSFHDPAAAEWRDLHLSKDGKLGAFPKSWSRSWCCEGPDREGEIQGEIPVPQEHRGMRLFPASQSKEPQSPWDGNLPPGAAPGCPSQREPQQKNLGVKCFTCCYQPPFPSATSLISPCRIKYLWDHIFISLSPSCHSLFPPQFPSRERERNTPS